MSQTHRMACARWDSGTGHGPKLQPLTLAFMARDAMERAVKMGSPAHKAFEIVPVDVTICALDEDED